MGDYIGPYRIEDFNSLDFQRGLLQSMQQAVERRNRVMYIVKDDKVIDIVEITGRAQWIKMLWKKAFSSPDQGKYYILNRNGKEFLTRQIIRTLQTDEAESAINYKKVDDYVKTIETLNFKDPMIQERVQHLRKCTHCFGKLEGAIEFIKELPKSEEPIKSNDELFDHMVDYLKLSYLNITLTDAAKKILEEEKEADANFPGFQSFTEETKQQIAAKIKAYISRIPPPSFNFFSVDLDRAARTINPDEKNDLYHVREGNYAFKKEEGEEYFIESNVIVSVRENLLTIKNLMKEIKEGKLPPDFNIPSPLARQLEILNDLEKLKDKPVPFQEFYQEELQQIPDLYESIRKNLQEDLDSLNALHRQITSTGERVPREELVALGKIEAYERFFSIQMKDLGKHVEGFRKQLVQEIENNKIFTKLNMMKTTIKNNILDQLNDQLAIREELVKKTEEKWINIQKQYEKESVEFRELRNKSVDHLLHDDELAELLETSKVQSKEEQLLTILIELSIKNEKKEKLNKEEVQRFSDARKELAVTYPKLKDLQPEHFRKNSTLLSLIEKAADAPEKNPVFVKILSYVKKDTDTLPSIGFPTITVEKVEDESGLVDLVHYSLKYLTNHELSEEESHLLEVARNTLSHKFPELKNYQPEKFLENTKIHTLMKDTARENPVLAKGLQYILDGIDARNKFPSAEIHFKDIEKQYNAAYDKVADVKEKRNKIIQMIDAIEADKPNSLDEAITLLAK